jgi:hypothetical protein
MGGPSAEVSPVNVHDLMREIRGRLRRVRRDRAAFLRHAERVISPALAMSLKNLESQVVELRNSVEAIGAMPPVPDTLRGRVGAFLVRRVRKALFWLIPPLQTSHIKIVGALEEQRRALVEITNALRQVNSELVALKSGAPPLSSGPNTDAALGKPVPVNGDQALQLEKLPALLERLEEANQTQCRIQRELFNCLASVSSRDSVRTPSVSAGRNTP